MRQFSAFPPARSSFREPDHASHSSEVRVRSGRPGLDHRERAAADPDGSAATVPAAGVGVFTSPLPTTGIFFMNPLLSIDPHQHDGNLGTMQNLIGHAAQGPAAQSAAAMGGHGNQVEFLFPGVVANLNGIFPVNDNGMGLYFP